ncbi:MAG TPA: hypothetical protein VGJ66_17545, partial [Pyrinomonadaceae bacterium]
GHCAGARSAAPFEMLALLPCALANPIEEIATLIWFLTTIRTGSGSDRPHTQPSEPRAVATGPTLNHQNREP